MTEEQIAKIVDEIIAREGRGKFTNRKNDRGGPTYEGITWKTYRAWCRQNGHELLSSAQFEAFAKDAAKDPKHPLNQRVREIYTAEYVDRFLPLPAGLREMTIDAGVNCGWPRSARWCQKLCGVAQDGIIGPATLRAARELWKQGRYVRRAALTDLACERMEYYGRLCRRHPDQLANIIGWTRRTFKVLQESVGVAK